MTVTTNHWQASQYSKNSRLQYDAAMDALAEYAFKGNENVLDVGCGDGKITYQIALKTPQGFVLGVDASENMITYAKENFLQQKNLSFTVKEAENLGAQKEKFDLATSFFCLHWVPNKLLALQEIRKNLKTHAKFILLASTRQPQMAALRQNLMQAPEWKDYFKNYTDPTSYISDAKYDEYAKKAGFFIDNYSLETVTAHFENATALNGFLTNITPHLSQLPKQSQKEAFIKALVDGYLKISPPTKDGSCEITYHCVKMLATAISIQNE